MPAANAPAPDAELSRMARRRARARLGWIVHAAIYVIVNAALMLIPFGNGHPWGLYPALGWGIGLIAHGLAVRTFATGSELNEPFLARDLDLLRRQQPETVTRHR